MEYYIEPAEQTAEVQEQLDGDHARQAQPGRTDAARSGLRLRSHPGRSLRPVQSDLPGAWLSATGYPALILEKNLFGLEIDDRAAQLAAFALMMKARADDRRLLERG